LLSLLSVYQLPDLPYETGALEPYLSKASIDAQRALQSRAVGVLNANYNGKGKNIPLYKLQSEGGLTPELKAAAGSHYNYCLFFSSLAPEDDTSAPSPILRKLFDAQWGGEDGFQAAFAAAAVEVAGAGGGWVWLSGKPGAKLTLTTTRGFENPFTVGGGPTIPFLCLAVVPVAYAEQFGGETPAAVAKYTAAFFNVVNWRRVSANYIQFATNLSPVPCTQGDLLGVPPPSFTRG
jgi:Fe-Mn family superoxide dismutase